MGMAFIARDGSSEDALAQIVSQHRSTFTAGLDLTYARQWCDTMPAPEAGSACSELLADDEEVHATTQRERAKQFRHLGAYSLVAILAVLCFALPLGAHIFAKEAPKPVKQPVSLGVWA